MIINPNSSSKHGRIRVLLVLFSLLSLLTSSYGQPTPNYDPYANATFSPSMAIIIVILIAALFFMGFFSIYIRHCTTSDSNSAVRPVSGSQRNRRAAARGLDAAVIQTFPTLVYSEVKVLKIGKGALECAVCLCEFEDDERLRLIPKCDHVFHPDCIDAWLSNHTTCPVCRANLNLEPGEPVTQPGELELESPENELDVEAQNGVEQSGHPDDADVEAAHPQHGQAPEPQVIDLMSRTLNRNRTRGSRSNNPRKFPRSHSTGHSLIQPGENTERFTLRLPVDVRKQIMNRELNRSNSLVVLPREGSSRRGYRTGGEGSSRGKSIRWPSFKSDRWVFTKGSFFSRASSLRSPKVAAGNELPIQPAGPESSMAEPGRPPV